MQRVKKKNEHANNFIEDSNMQKETKSIKFRVLGNRRTRNLNATIQSSGRVTMASNRRSPQSEIGEGEGNWRSPLGEGEGEIGEGEGEMC